MLSKIGTAFLALLIFVCGAASIWGYVDNIIKLCHMSFQTFTPELIARLVGIPIVPLGIVMGYIM